MPNPNLFFARPDTGSIVASAYLPTGQARKLAKAILQLENATWLGDNDTKSKNKLDHYEVVLSPDLLISLTIETQ